MMAKQRVTPLPRAVDTRLLDDDAHVRIDTVARECSLQPGTIRNLIAHTPPRFPLPIPKDHPGPNYWRLGDVRKWLQSNRGLKAAQIETGPKARSL